jgi:hypothetical protein
MILLVARASAGAAHLNFYRKVRRNIGRPEKCSFELLIYLRDNEVASSATMNVRRHSSGYSREAEKERRSSTSNHKPVI